MTRLVPIVLLLVFLPCYVYSLHGVERERKGLQTIQSGSYVLPSPVLRALSLEYEGVMSDAMFLKALVFFGGTFERQERPRVKAEEWEWIYSSLMAATDLDPYFLDPYYFGNAVLSWEAMMLSEANILLQKGAYYRTWDDSLLFYLGFNSFYFQHDNVKAAEYLMRASKIPGASPVLASLASRLAYKGDKTENAVMFLEEILAKSKDKTLRTELEKRLATLKGILALEKGMEAYNAKFGTKPSNLRELVARGVIEAMPVDPFGGEFYINGEGAVKTTSDMRYLKKKN